MNKIKKSLYTASWLTLLAINNAVNAGGFWEDKVNLPWAKSDIATTIQSFLTFIATFLSLIAVIFIVYAGFSILTAWGDDEKVKKWKTTIINAVIGLVVIWLAYSIVLWITNALYTSAV